MRAIRGAFHSFFKPVKDNKKVKTKSKVNGRSSSGGGGIGIRYFENEGDVSEEIDVVGLRRKVQRQTRLVRIFIVICCIVISSWFFGSCEFSFAWIIALLFLLFLIWRSEIFEIIEESIHYEEIRIHRKRALRQSETAEWLNFIINRWWLFSSPSIFALVKKHLDPILQNNKPAFLDSIELHHFTLGEETPRISYVSAFDAVNLNCGLKTTDSLPKQNDKYHIVLELDVNLCCADFQMTFIARLGGKLMAVDTEICLEKLNISGKLQLVLNFDAEVVFPHIASLSVSFMEKPDVWFSVRLLKAVQMMEVPILKQWLHSMVMDALATALVDPGKLDIKITSAPRTSEAPTDQNAHGDCETGLKMTVNTCPKQKTDLGGIPSLMELTVIRAKDLVAKDLNGFSDPYCEVKIQNEIKLKTRVKKKTLNPVWKESVTTPLPLEGEKLVINVWDWDIFGPRDFLGSVSFSLDDIRSLSRKDAPEWFSLNKVKSGLIQIKVKIVEDSLEDLVGDLLCEESFVRSKPRFLNKAKRLSLPNTPSHISDLHLLDVSHPWAGGIRRPGSMDALVLLNTSREEGTFPQVSESPSLKRAVDKKVSSAAKISKFGSPRKRLIPTEPPSPGRRFLDSKASPPRISHSIDLTRLSEEFSISSETLDKDFNVRSALRSHLLSARSSVSDVSLYSDVKKHRQGTESFELSSLAIHDSPLKNAIKPMSSLTDRYYFIQGCILQAHGLKAFTTSKVCCEVKLESPHASKKSSTSPRPLGKSEQVEVADSTVFNTNFQLDSRKGKPLDSVLTIDIKDSHKDIVDNTAVVLHEILKDQPQVLHWLPMNRGTLLQIEMSHGKRSDLKHKRSPLHFFHSLSLPRFYKHKDQ